MPLSVPARPRRLILALGLVLGSLLGPACQGERAASTPDGADPAVLASHPDDPLGLVLRPVGGADEVPVQLAFRAGAELWPSELVGGPPLEGTELRIEPPVPGRLEIQDDRSFAFLPEQGFRPGTSYRARLDRLVTLDATLEPPAPDAWTTSFQTPPFAFLRATGLQRDRERGLAEIELAFSAPVRLDSLRGRLGARSGGQALEVTVLGAQGDGRRVRVRLAGAALKAEEAKVELSLDAGVAWAGDPTVQAPAGSGELRLRDGRPVEVMASFVREGASGFYIDVVCNDRAVTQTRWYWDRQSWDGWDISTRCMLDPEMAESHVRLNGRPATVAEGGGGFRVFGELPRGPVRLQIAAGARTLDGGVFREAYEAELEVPRRTERLSFLRKGRYLPREAWRSLAIEHMNLKEARLVVRHIPVQNLPFWLSGAESADERTSNVIVDQPLALKGVEDQVGTAYIDVGALVPQASRGVYEIRISGGSASDSSRLLLTDMHLLAKRAAAGPDEPFPTQVWAWALGMKDNAPLPGVELRLVRPSGQSLASCRTDASGGCLLQVRDWGADTTAPIAIIAQRGDDLSYLRFADVQVRPDADLTGVAYRDDSPYRAAVWTDRGVYRPGDTLHLGATVRDRGHGAPSQSLPVVVRLRDPRQREVRKQVVNTNEAGTFALDLPFADFAATGTWTASLEVANQPVGQARFQVEEFVPERLAVQATVPQGARPGGYLLSEEVPVQVDARWLFGGRAGGARVELECELQAAPFQPADSEAARWSHGRARLDEQERPALKLGRVEDRLDDEGRATLRCPAAQAGPGAVGSARLQARVRVFEGDSGRSTLAAAEVAVHPAPFYIGLSTPMERARAGERLPVEGRVVDWQGQPARIGLTQVELRLYRLESEYTWLWDEAAGDTSYRRTRRRVLETRVQVPVRDGRFATELVASGDGGGWLIEARAGDARSERLIEGEESSWWWDDPDATVDQTPRPQRPGAIKLEVPAEAEPGEQVTVVARAPYAGRMLLSLETDRVLRTEWRTVQAGEVRWTVPLTEVQGEAFVPNVYVGALLVKDPALESPGAFLPDRAIGAASIKLRPSRYSQPVAIQVPDEARPWSPLKVSLDLGRTSEPTYVTVAVVDEGILSLTRFQSPDPRDQVFARRALGVDSFETVGWTIPGQPGGAASRTGGDAAGGIGRVQMVKPVALWSGLLRVPDSGRLDVDFDLPGYRGTLRVMAVATGSSRLGAAQARVVVREPIVLQTTLPRFLVAGDLARIPIHLTNTSGRPQKVSVEVGIQDLARAGADGLGPALELVAPPGAPVELADGASQTVLVQVAARRGPAAARLSVTARAGNLRSHEELDVPIGTAEPEVRQVKQLELGPGSHSLTAALQGWQAGTDQSSLWLSSSPYAGSLSHLSYLARYPYGCVEQTTSGTRPLLYVRELVERFDSSLLADASVDDMVRSGIERVLSMQTPSGGFAYWPGSEEPSLWGTAYATHMLIDAREAGHAVPAAAVDGAVGWLSSTVGGRGGVDPELAYAHYVLARAGRARPAQALRMLEELRRQGEDPQRAWWRMQREEQEYLLMAAMYLGGDQRHEAELRRPELPAGPTLRANDASWFSGLRARGLRLAVYQDLFGAAAEGRAAADALAAALAGQRSSSFSTQELGWAITALGKRMNAADASLQGASLVVDGRPRTETGRAAWVLADAGARRSVELTVPKTAGRAFLVLSTRGVPKTDAVPLGARGLTLRRSFVDGEGQELDIGRLPLGTPFYVRLSLRNDTGRSQQNLALVDRLPAGWEIENARLSGAAAPPFAEELELWAAEHMNLRDDRVEVFGSLGAREERTVLYAVRAVTSGSFALPPAQAEAMYDPDIWARIPGGRVEVVGPWDDGLL